MSDKRSQLYDLLLEAPKPQLHLHLDGSLSLKFIKESISRMTPDRQRLLFPNDLGSNTESELRDWLMGLKELQIKRGSVVDTNSNWKVFDFCNQFLQTRDDLHLATYDLVTRLSKVHNVNYIEIRFAPILHTTFELDEESALKAVLQGFNSAVHDLAALDRHVSGGVIVCALRSYPVTCAEKTLELIKKVDGVLGFDIAGDEGTYPLAMFETVLRLAKQQNIRTTVHAGEWNETTNSTILDNLKLSVDIGVDRIGHALALRSASAELINDLSSKNIPVEVCLTANCGNSNKCKSYSAHPVNMMLRENIHVAAFNCDNLLLSGSKLTGAPDPTSECVRALIDCSTNINDFLKIIQNGYLYGFNKQGQLIGEQSMQLWQKHFLPNVLSILSDIKGETPPPNFNL